MLKTITTSFITNSYEISFQETKIKKIIMFCKWYWSNKNMIKCVSFSLLCQLALQNELSLICRYDLYKLGPLSST